MAQLVYILCTVTSLACAALLGRAYFRTKMRLLLWAGICFVALALNNVLLFLDVVVFPDVTITTYRGPVALIGLVAMIYGLVWDAA
jgi:hypothetical protein